jgi:hypothetical protein
MVGVCTHYTGGPANYNIDEMLKKVGVKFVRAEYLWRWAEKVKGKYFFDPRMQAYIDKLNTLNIKIIMILDYSNTNYTTDSHTGPNTPELRKAFGDYVAFMVSTLKGKVYAWEIWNEPDQPGNWKPAPNSRDYSLLVKHVAPIIRRIDPKALIIALATKPNPDYLNSLEKGNALADVDIISIHWYTHPKPPDQGWAPIKMDLTSVRTFIQEIKRLGKRVWITEMGYPTSTDRYGVSEAQQAEYLEQQLKLASNMGAEVCIIYDLIDDGPDKGNKEHCFGLFKQDGSPKPAVSVVQSFAQ